jgi:ribosomal protein S18 acetylase RimI-like enzyme
VWPLAYTVAIRSTGDLGIDGDGARRATLFHTMPTIRRYQESDWQSFVDLDVETGIATLRHATDHDRGLYRERWAGVLQQQYAWTPTGPTADKAVLYVLQDDEGGYAGHLWLCEQPDVRTGIPRLWVTTMAIVQKHRSRGWGRLLVEKTEEEARLRGLTSIGLGVDADNVVARKLYEEMGFETVRLRMIRTL